MMRALFTRRPAIGAIVCLAGWLSVAGPMSGQAPPLADESDRAAFRNWFTLLADLQFEHPAPEVIDCAALVRFAYREALRPHTPEWARRVGLPMTPVYPDVRSGPRPGPDGWPLFRVSAEPRFAEFADARTLIALNARALGRDPRAARPGDLLYFRQPDQRQPDHVMVFVGRSVFDPDGTDWIVYHTGPSSSAQSGAGTSPVGSAQDGPGEVRKVRMSDLVRHPAPRWRPLSINPQFVGVFRLSLL